MTAFEGKSIVDAADIVFSYGSRRVIDGLTLSIAAGEIFGPLGANAAGKTTFVRMLAGSGVIIPVDQMPAVMEGMSIVLPLTYAVKGLREIMLQGHGLAVVWPELAVLAAFGVSLLAAAVVALRRT
jgi:ABC-type hemin transport system ATPase subunit